MITSATNERVRQARALLNEAKTRRRTGLLALEGVRLIRDALLSGGQPEYILHTPAFDPAVLHSERPLDPRLLLSTADEVMRAIAATDHSQGVIGIFPTPVLPLPEQPRRVLVLDGMRDPGNAGTMLRTAAACGVEVVLFAPGSVDATNDKVLRGAMGAHFRIAWREWTWTQIAHFCAGTTVYLADMTGDVPYDAADWRAGWTLIVGGEADGASAEADALAARRVYIPMRADAESLNAAVAAGVLLFEAYRADRHAPTE
jgi:TrmH family RNA methyltransferase